jgi:hypothetical protein
LRKSQYKQLQKLELANSTLLISLITEMHDKGLIDGEKVLKEYKSNLDEVIEKVSIKK